MIQTTLVLGGGALSDGIFVLYCSSGGGEFYTSFVVDLEAKLVKTQGNSAFGILQRDISLSGRDEAWRISRHRIVAFFHPSPTPHNKVFSPPAT